MTTISLLHATYRAGLRAIALHDAWIRTANSPDLVEHIFALDEDDPISMQATEGHRRVVNPPMRGVTAVRNWNSAANSATGDLLFVIADDLEPIADWDLTIREIVGALDPHVFPFAIGLAQDSKQTLLRHPLISRRFYTQFGLFSPEFTGVYCDDDITYRAYNDAVVLDGTSLSFLHHRPGNTAGFAWTESQTLINTPEEYETGKRVLLEKWSRRQRTIRLEYFTPPRGRAAPTVRASVWRVRLKVLGLLSVLTRRLRGWGAKTCSLLERQGRRCSQ